MAVASRSCGSVATRVRKPGIVTTQADVGARVFTRMWGTMIVAEDLRLRTDRLYSSWARYASYLPSEFLLQLRKRNLNHGRSSVGTAIRQITLQQIANQFFDLGVTQWIIRFDRVPAHGLGDHFLTQAHRRTAIAGAL